MVAYAFNPSTLEAETRGQSSLQTVSGQPTQRNTIGEGGKITQVKTEVTRTKIKLIEATGLQ